MSKVSDTRNENFWKQEAVEELEELRLQQSDLVNKYYGGKMWSIKDNSKFMELERKSYELIGYISESAVADISAGEQNETI